MAAPHVAGVMVKLLSEKGAMTLKEMRDKLIEL